MSFDAVDNDVLLSKFSAIGFTPHLLKFFASYLSERRQYVEYAGYQSAPYYTYSGVSQGSNLGPLEFVIMINDLAGVVKEAGCLLFADDLKVFLTVADAADCERLQSDIDRVVQWSRSNKLLFNVGKCSIMSFSRARTPLHYQYEVEGVGLPRTTSVRDLGLEMVPDLRFRRHIVNVCAKSFRNLGFILRQCVNFKNIIVIKVLYNALVRSHLETNAIIWNPNEAKYKLLVEKIQNKFTRFLYLKEYGVYPYYPLMYPSLFVLGMVGYCRLSVRRDVALVKYMVRVLRGELHHPAVLAALRLRAPNNYLDARRRPAMLEVPTCKTNLLKFAPMSLAIYLLNFLSQNSVDIFFLNLPKAMEMAQLLIETKL